MVLPLISVSPSCLDPTSRFVVFSLFKFLMWDFFFQTFFFSSSSTLFNCFCYDPVHSITSSEKEGERHKGEDHNGDWQTVATVAGLVFCLTEGLAGAQPQRDGLVGIGEVSPCRLVQQAWCIYGRLIEEHLRQFVSTETLVINISGLIVKTTTLFLKVICRK